MEIVKKAIPVGGVTAAELEEVRTIANAAMPQSGGMFTGEATAHQLQRNSVGLRNIAVYNNDWTTMPLTVNISFIRK
jgi:hypothetical protein